uniref:Uncharacterized protein n=1 Tax=Oryza sativa subsp. japonica TaxID=39947 RepID=Q6K645_ORYSJ|nr:hypothetical protein [Oryza sativa Japonica Group]BAD19676.1 hypothetical protein [Oryza sativa Japonica Group]
MAGRHTLEPNCLRLPCRAMMHSSYSRENGCVLVILGHATSQSTVVLHPLFADHNASTSTFSPHPRDVSGFDRLRCHCGMRRHPLDRACRPRDQTDHDTRRVRCW